MNLPDPQDVDPWVYLRICHYWRVASETVQFLGDFAKFAKSPQAVAEIRK
ncbi:hypothetical protein [Mycobacterium tuberculosis]|nr:hypothetical protein [Mycobacterium tuberculosis]KAF3412827.1 hypothetical protein BIT18_1936 [Mycobacterium tuberculosis variant bovis]